MSKKNNLYLGQAGQALVMSEFLKRGYNVALPQVDIGDDIFVLEDSKGDFYRIQVKTANATSTNYGFSARFNVPLRQLKADFTPPLFYVLVCNFKMIWQPLLIISKDELNDFHLEGNFGSTHKNQLLLYFQIAENATIASCSKKDFSQYLNNWSDFPTILH